MFLKQQIVRQNKIQVVTQYCAVTNHMVQGRTDDTRPSCAIHSPKFPQTLPHKMPNRTNLQKTRHITNPSETSKSLGALPQRRATWAVPAKSFEMLPGTQAPPDMAGTATHAKPMCSSSSEAHRMTDAGRNGTTARRQQPTSRDKPQSRPRRKVRTINARMATRNACA